MVVDLILVPYDSGHRGVRLGCGPEFLVEHGLVEQVRARAGEVRIHTIECALDFRSEAAVAFDLARSIADRVRIAHNQGALPVILAGNCMSALGVVAGLGGGAGTGVVWLDAHGDFNSPDTSVSAFLDGMSAAVLAGRCWSAAAARVPGFAPIEESNLVLVGARDLDAGESALLASSRVCVVPPAQVRDRARLASILAALPVQTLYLHVDLDVLDPERVGAANCFAAAGGLLLDDVLAIIRAVKEHHVLAAVTLSAYDPSFDANGAVRDAAFAIVLESMTDRVSEAGEPITPQRVPRGRPI